MTEAQADPSLDPDRLTILRIFDQLDDKRRKDLLLHASRLLIGRLKSKSATKA